MLSAFRTLSTRAVTRNVPSAIGAAFTGQRPQSRGMAIAVCCDDLYTPCSHEYESAFEVRTTHFKFGSGLINELGYEAKRLGMTRVGVLTDRDIAKQEWYLRAVEVLRKAGLDVAAYTECTVEPTDKSFQAAAAWAADAKCDGFVSVGGGSVMDTTKAANLIAKYPPAGGFLDYVNAPIGKGLTAPGALFPHIAVPTTCGTGAEATGFAICDLLDIGAKSGIGGEALIPSLALIDPDVTASLPKNVIAASAFDVLCHAIESYTAKPFTHRHAPPVSAPLRPLHQGANPYSDYGCVEVLRIAGKQFEAAIEHDQRALHDMTFAATLAGTAINNAGTQLPHGMSYAVSGMVRDFNPEGYPTDVPIVPHGMSVVLCAPACFEWTADTNPERHLKCAELLGATDLDPNAAGEVLGEQVIRLMKLSGVPNGLSAIGYDNNDLDQLVAKTLPQKRVVGNCPKEVEAGSLENVFKRAMKYW